MYVCICNAIGECEFRRAARCVPGNAEAIYAALGKRPQCRQCLEQADAIASEERAAIRPAALVA